LASARMGADYNLLAPDRQTKHIPEVLQHHVTQ